MDDKNLDFMDDKKYNGHMVMKEVEVLSEKKKMGRPKSDNPKTLRVQVRFTEEEYNKLKECADRHNLTITQVVRKGADDLAESWK